MAEHRSVVHDPKEKPENYVWKQGSDFYERRDVAGMHLRDGRLKRINCSMCGLAKGYLPSQPCDCHPGAEWEVRVRPLPRPAERPVRLRGYTALPAGGGTLNPATPHVLLSDLPAEEPLTRAVARRDLEAEGFVLPAPGFSAIKQSATNELMKIVLKRSGAFPAHLEHPIR